MERKSVLGVLNGSGNMKNVYIFRTWMSLRAFSGKTGNIQIFMITVAWKSVPGTINVACIDEDVLQVVCLSKLWADNYVYMTAIKKRSIRAVNGGYRYAHVNSPLSEKHHNMRLI